MKKKYDYLITKGRLKETFVLNVKEYDFKHSVTILKELVNLFVEIEYDFSSEYSNDDIISFLQKINEKKEINSDVALLEAYFLSLKEDDSVTDRIIFLLENYNQKEEFKYYIYAIHLINTNNYKAAYVILYNIQTDMIDFGMSESPIGYNAHFMYLKGLCEEKLNFKNRASISYYYSYNLNRNVSLSLKKFYKLHDKGSYIPINNENLLLNFLKYKVPFKIFKKMFCKTINMGIYYNGFDNYINSFLKKFDENIYETNEEIDLFSLFGDNFEKWKSVFIFSNPLWKYDDYFDEFHSKEFEWDSSNKNNLFYDDSLEMDEQSPEFWDNI